MLTVMTPEELLSCIAAAFAPLDRPPETVRLDRALGRVLARDILADQFVPGFCRSTVDGYALRGADTFGCSESIPALLAQVGAVEMGREPTFSLGSGQCAAIPTGGALPKGADAVQMVEHTEDFGGGEIGIYKSVPPGANLIFKGDDVKPGDRVLEQGRRLEPQDIGALAALGVTAAPVVPRLRIGLLSTGDELVPPETAPGPGQVRDVNGPLVAALVAQAGAEPVWYGIVPDREEVLRQTVERALEQCDGVVLSGGSSVGEKDAACRVLTSLGEVLCHGVAMKPGKPTLLGRAGGKPILGLPGHPAAALFTARLFLLPLLTRLEGGTWRQQTASARLAQTVPANHGRAQYTGVTLEERSDGLWAVPIWGKSGLITTLAGADGFICVSRDREGIPAGERVEVSLFG
nr:gephyrin-like molybdotransferase Glp [uncultured Flavonifractor sp.]